MFPRNVERWRALASQEARGLLVPWILAVILRESGGEPGAKGRTGDFGLMQTKPALLAGYNANNPDRITYADIIATDNASARKQIRAGVWYLGLCASHIHDLDHARFPWPDGTPSDEQILYSDLCYGAGVAGFLNYRNQETRAGSADDFESLAARAPGSDKWKIPPRKFGHARAVLALTRSDGEKGRSTPPRSQEPPEPGDKGAPTNGGDGTGGLILAAALMLALSS